MPETANGPTWGTVTTADEPLALLLAFTAHHLELGAEEMHVYLDRPNADFSDLARAKPRLRVTICDDAYWRDVHGRERPGDFRQRQTLNANHAFRLSRTEWLMHLDCDEYLIRLDLVLKTLRECPPDIVTVGIPNGERVYLAGRRPGSVFDGIFRRPFPPDEGQAMKKVYGASAQYLSRGLSGYPGIKSFYRVGSGVTLGIHQPLPPNDWISGNPASKRLQRTALLHFDGLTERHWCDKMEKRIRLAENASSGNFNPARLRQIRTFAAAKADPAAMRRLYRASQTVTWRQLAGLALRRKLMPVRFDLSKALAEQWPGQTVDLSHEGLDAALAQGQEPAS